jgi:hypothetical protein
MTLIVIVRRKTKHIVFITNVLCDSLLSNHTCILKYKLKIYIIYDIYYSICMDTFLMHDAFRKLCQQRMWCCIQEVTNNHTIKERIRMYPIVYAIL